MKESIYRNLSDIAEGLSNELTDESIFLSLGKLLFLIEYDMFIGKSIDRHMTTLSNGIDKLYSEVGQTQSICNGFMSFGFLYRHLVRKGLIVKDTDFEKSVEHICCTYGDYYLTENNFDYLHGATGVAHYLLQQKSLSEAANSFIDRYLDALEDKKIFINHGVAWRDVFTEHFEKETFINIGLAHGVPAILKVLAQINAKTSGKLRDTRKLISETEMFLRNSCNKDRLLHSRYSTKIQIGSDAEHSSRLSWCYGDLSIGLVLYQVGISISDKEMAIRGLDLVSITAKRGLDRSGVLDAGICHGSSGVAYLFMKMWHYTGNTEFKEAMDYWLLKTRSLGTVMNNALFFERFNPTSNRYERCDSLLEGTAGVGLVLLSSITQDFSWDNCLLLNNIDGGI